MIYLLMLLGGLLPLAFLPDSEDDADEPDDDMLDVGYAGSQTVSLDLILGDGVDTMDTASAPSIIDDLLLAPADEIDVAPDFIPDAGDVLAPLTEVDADAVLAPVVEIDLPTLETDFDAPLAPVVEIDLEPVVTDPIVGEVLAPVIETDTVVDAVLAPVIGDDTYTEFVVTAGTTQGSVEPAEVVGFEVGLDEVRLTLDPAYFGDSPMIATGVSDSGLDGWISVNDQVIALVLGAPEITIADVTIVMSVV